MVLNLTPTDQPPPPAAPSFDPDFLEATYRITAVETLRAISGVTGLMADNPADWQALNFEYLQRFGTYLACLTQEEKDELAVLLANRLDDEAVAELAPGAA